MMSQTELKRFFQSVKLKEKEPTNCHISFFCPYICINEF